MISNDYLYTDIWDDPSIEVLPENSLYIYANDPEDRSTYCVRGLKPNNTSTNFVEVEIDNQDQMLVSGVERKVSLSSTDDIAHFYTNYNPTIIFLDVTGMNCRLAAPLMKCAMDFNFELRIVYTEPKEYLLDQFKKEGLNKDLSGTISGINPLPGFTKILPHRTEPIFVTLLGFEGGRLSYVISSQQPSDDRIRPVVGVPGYRIDYPFETYWGNRNSLRKTRAWEHVSFAEANSIVDSYMTLKKISYQNRDPEMVIAPIGTKPHAIGAILYAIKNDKKVELLYDNPIGSVQKTEGIGRTLVCNVTKLYNEN